MMCTYRFAIRVNLDFESIGSLYSRNGVQSSLVQLGRIVDQRDGLPLIDQIIDLL